jgi:hypothetical protein
MYDLTGDSNEEILISRQEGNNNNQLRLFTSIYRPTGIVPVELISFTASTSGNNVLLNWSTASELNNKGFEIERSSVNGHWSLVGFVEGNGTTTEQKNYSYKDSSLTSGKYFYRLKQIDYNGRFRYSQEVEVDLSNPFRYSLEQNYPNPFNPITKIQFAVGNRQFVSLKVYDILGRQVATLVSEEKSLGSYTIEFNAGELSSGIYFYQLKAGDFISTKKLVLLK